MEKRIVRSVFMLFGVCCLFAASAGAAEMPNPFFAMDTIARGEPSQVVPMLKELGYAGLGGTAGDGAMAKALTAEGLRFFNGYLTLELHAEQPVLNERLRQTIDAMQGCDTALWIALQSVLRDGASLQKSSPEAAGIAAAQLREIADYARRRGVGIALYPHAGMWMESVEDALRLAEQTNDAAIGVTFNLCHWLKVEGAERDPEPVLRAALPRLLFVTINGADTGDTRHMGWDRLIQPLDRGSYDVGAFLRKLRAVGYVGPVGFQGFGIKDEPREVLARTMAAWRTFSAESGR